MISVRGSFHLATVQFVNCPNLYKTSQDHSMILRQDNMYIFRPSPTFLNQLKGFSLSLSFPLYPSHHPVLLDKIKLFLLLIPLFTIPQWCLKSSCLVHLTLSVIVIPFQFNNLLNMSWYTLYLLLYPPLFQLIPCFGPSMFCFRS